MADDLDDDWFVKEDVVSVEDVTSTRADDADVDCEWKNVLRFIGSFYFLKFEFVIEWIDYIQS